MKKLGPVSFLVRELYENAPERKVYTNQLKIFKPVSEFTTPHDIDGNVNNESDDPYSVALLAAFTGYFCDNN